MEWVNESGKYHNKNIPEISVIIPCYNSQETIVRSLESLERQTYKNFEVVIVNDGSKDGTVAIIENYKKKTLLNIRLISQDNGGVSAARNTGLTNAKGRFITFLDADDRYHPSFLELLYDAITQNNVDFALSKYILKTNRMGGLIVATHDIKNTYVSKVDVIRIYSHKRIERVNFWCGIYCKDILRKYNIDFSVGVKYGEDTQFFFDYLFRCNKGGIYIETPLYEYVKREDSATHKINYDMIQNIEVYRKISFLWSGESDFVSNDMGRYLVNRAIWGVAKKFALLPSKDAYVRLQKEYNVREAMQYMIKYGDEKSIRFSAKVYCICSDLFRILVKLYEKMSKV